MTNRELMITWCRMWSEDPALAHELMTDDCVQWSGQTPGLDPVVGPAQQEQFVTGYRAQHVNVFTPRVLADGGDAFAYTWDVATPDGRLLTGMDVNVLAGDRVRENWTFVAGKHYDLPDPAEDDSPAPADLADRWLAGKADAVTDDLRVFAGAPDDLPAGAPAGLRGPAALVALPAGRVLHRAPVLAPGRVALLWTAEDGTGGADLLALRAGRVATAWSFGGSRAFRY